MRLMICGHGRHGKDTVAEMICQCRPDLAWANSSAIAAEVMFEHGVDFGNYASAEEMFNDRHNHRADWFNWIQAYNDPKYKLAEQVFLQSDIYVGVRCREELLATMRRFPEMLTIWVDASERQPPEPWTSMTITRDMADVVIENNGCPNYLFYRVRRFANALGK